MYYVNIDLHQQYGISVADSQRFYWQNVPGSEELGEMAVFAGWGLNGTFIKSKIKKESLENNKIHIKMLISPPQFALTGRFLASEHFSSIW